MNARVVSINISDRKGVRKKPVEEVELRENFGISGDAHASSEWHRQVSLLAMESIRKMKDMGLDVGPGDFAENITTEGIDLLSLPIGTRLLIGGRVEVEVSQIGKECHSRCSIYYQAGDCVMPKEGIFVRVLRGGKIKIGDPIEIKGTEMISLAIITLSDKGSKGEREDLSGQTIRELVSTMGMTVKHYEIIPDERDILKERLLRLSREVDLILTTGGTGLAPRDITPDVTLEVIDREIPGIAEAMRMEGLKKTARAMLSRAVAGVKGQCLIVNLPGSPKAVREGLEAIMEVIPHAVEKIKGSEEECAR